MATGCTGNSGTTLRAGARNGWKLAAVLAAVASGAAVMSGCAGLATTSNANPTPESAVQISPATISFGNVAAGQKSTQTATLTNTGKEAVTITNVALSSSEFSAAGLATPLMIGPGQSAKFQVVFTGGSGTAEGTLSAMTSRGGSSTKVHLNGSGPKANAQLSLSASTLNFGNVLVNGSSTQSVTLKNSGTADLQVSQIAVSGGSFAESGVVAPLTIAAGQSAVLQAKFAPSTGGAASGSIKISSNAQNSTATVALSGFATTASYTMALAPAALSFGNINAGSKATQTIALSNTGNTSVTVTQVAASGSGISVSGVTTPFSLAPAQTANLTVQFAPTTSGAVSGSVTVTNNDGVNVMEGVSGTGVQAALSVVPGSVSFGSVVTGNTNSQTIQVKNTGTANLSVSQVTVSGTGFSLSGTSLPMSLAAGQSGNFNVQYAPTSGGNSSGAINIVSSAPNSPATVAVSGTGVAATSTITLSPASLSFGNVTDGNTSTQQSFTVTNTGNSNVSVSGITIAGTGFSIVSGSGAVTLSPNQSTSVGVQFAPTTAGSANGSVNVASNATGSASSVSLSGTGVAPTVNHTVGLNWGASTSSVSGYNVYRSSVSGSAYSKVNSSLVGGVSFSDGNVQSGQTYYYVATSIDSNGIESVYSNEVSAIVP